jgi:hypothetical protein
VSEIVNLRMARKAKKRAEAASAAQDNRIAFGRSKQEREIAAKEKAFAQRKLDAHLLNKDKEPS